MKKTILLLSTIGLTAGLQAQTPVTVSISPTYTDQVWYSFQNGEVGRAPLQEWDLAFELTGLTAGVRVNTAKGSVVYETPFTFGTWNQLNAPDEAAWTRIDNDVARWDMGALNHGNNMDDPDGFNVGWGNYNPVNHQMIGNKVYAVLLPDDTWKKLRINSVISGVFSFTYANLDGTDSHDASINKANYTGKNFAYWSFGTNAAMDREPASANWDLLFTKYTDFVPTPYNVTGVLQNRNVTALEVDGVPTDQADWWGGDFSSDINIIGSDWKRYSGSYVIAPDTTYFVKDRAGSVWKIVFTGFGGSATGDMNFNQELMSPAAVSEVAVHQAALRAWPNPVEGSQAQVQLELPQVRGTLRVFNAAGRQVAVHQWNQATGVLALDVKDLAAGVYTLRFEADKAVATGKLVVQ